MILFFSATSGRSRCFLFQDFYFGSWLLDSVTQTANF